MQCPKCGLDNDDKLRFCRSCGGPLAATLPARPQPTAVTEPLPLAPPAPVQPVPAVAPAPPASAPPVAAPTPFVAPTAIAAARPNNTPLIVALIVIGGLLVLGLGALGGIAAYRARGPHTSGAVSTNTSRLPETSDTTRSEPPVSGEEKPSVEQPTETTPVLPAIKPASATAPVAEATVVLEKYLAADLGHNGNEMKKYLGGQALARFDPSVVGQEDIAVLSKQISGHMLRDDHTIEFTVAVDWVPVGSTKVKTDTQHYVLRRTDEGFKVVSTPEYPEEQ